MKKLIFVCFLFACPFLSQAQSDSLVQKDRVKLLLKPINGNPFRYKTTQSLNFSIHTFDFESSSCRFTLFQDTRNPRSVVWDNYKQEYLFGDPFQPYSSLESALIGGSLNYLFLLLDSKR